MLREPASRTALGTLRLQAMRRGPLNATGSPAGINYAAAHSDLVFITSPAGHEIDAALAALPAHNAVIKAAGAARARELRTIINPMIVCRETDREAQRYHAAILDEADQGAVEG